MSKLLTLILGLYLANTCLASMKYGGLCSDESPGHVHPKDAPPHSTVIKAIAEKPKAPPVSQMPVTRFAPNPMMPTSRNTSDVEPTSLPTKQ